jgi:hypothetical protein
VTRATIAGAALALLAGCPLPQPLPSYPAGSVTPPRILMDPLAGGESIVRVPAGCTGTSPGYDLAAALIHTNTSETVTARWFVDYDRRNSLRCAPAVPQELIPGPGDNAPDPTHREVSPYRFVPYDHPAVIGSSSSPAAAGVVHVVELVVSNGFDPAVDDVGLCSPDDPGTALPYRTPARNGDVQFETQAYRWVFVSEPASTDVPCP